MVLILVYVYAPYHATHCPRSDRGHTCRTHACRYKTHRWRRSRCSKFSGYDSKFMYYGGNHAKDKGGNAFGARKSTFEKQETPDAYVARREREDAEKSFFWVKDGKGFRCREPTVAENRAKARTGAAAAGRNKANNRPAGKASKGGKAPV